MNKLFRFTIVSLLNEYEQKFENYISSSQINELKKEILLSISESNKKEKILDDEEALILGTFIISLGNSKLIVDGISSGSSAAYFLNPKDSKSEYTPKSNPFSEPP